MRYLINIDSDAVDLRPDRLERGVLRILLLGVDGLLNESTGYQILAHTDAGFTSFPSYV